LSSIEGFDINSVLKLFSSNGWYVTNPKSLKNSETKLKELQRMLSRQKKGSKRWKNTKQRLQQVHLKIRRQRLDFGHQVSSTIAKCFDLVVFEDLNVKSMQQWNGRMTGDNLMREIVSLTRYKMERTGGLTHKINRFAASTKVCNSCHHTRIMGLNDRVFKCQACDYAECRDWNSAKNIEEIGAKELIRAGTACWALPTSQVKSTVKTKVRTLVRLDVESAKRDAA
jgi:putative transposase